jgi:tetratricopeptide (TPR) repeat protein
MLKWIKKAFEAYLTRLIDRQMRRLLDAGDYESVLRYATTMCQKRPNNATALYRRALALLWLGRDQEALDIANQVERLRAHGILRISDSWVTVFEEIKCGALSGLEQYETLYDCSLKCLERHPGMIPISSFQLLGHGKWTIVKHG